MLNVFQNVYLVGRGIIFQKKSKFLELEFWAEHVNMLVLPYVWNISLKMEKNKHFSCELDQKRSR